MPPSTLVASNPRACSIIGGELAPVAAPADHGDGLREIEDIRADARHDIVQRDVECTLDAARVPLGLLAAVDELDVIQRLVDAFDGAEIGHRLGC